MSRINKQGQTFLPHPSQNQGSYEHNCPGCGRKFLAKAHSQCPNCHESSVADGDEFTKKVIDDNDLIKSL